MLEPASSWIIIVRVSAPTITSALDRSEISSLELDGAPSSVIKVGPVNRIVIGSPSGSIAAGKL